MTSRATRLASLGSHRVASDDFGATRISPSRSQSGFHVSRSRFQSKLPGACSQMTNP